MAQVGNRGQTPCALQQRRWLAVNLAAASFIAAVASSWFDHRLSAQPSAAPPGPAPASVGSAARGKTIYQNHCAECHGESGQGDGPAAPLLVPRPRDFTLGRYKIRSTETGSIPTDEDLLRSVRQGLPGSAMPGWEGILADSDIREVVAHLKTLSGRFATETPRPIALPPVTAARTSAVNGAAVYQKLQCGKCHGVDGQGTGAVATTFEDDWRQPLRATDLTEPWTFHGGPAAADVFMRFSAGMSGTPMPSFKGAATDAEMWDLADYVVSLARKPVWEMDAEEIAAFYAAEDAAAKANPIKRGEYLARTHACVHCHSPVDERKRRIPGLAMAGGRRIDIEPFGTYTTGNLTSDQETGLGNWTDADIKRVITQGILKDGTRLLPFPMDWPAFASMTPDDLNALVAYLRSLPPVRNRIPSPSRPMLPLYLWGKFRMLILGADLPMTFHSGNAGSAAAGGEG